MVEPACAKADATTALEELTALLCLAERMGEKDRRLRNTLRRLHATSETVSPLFAPLTSSAISSAERVVLAKLSDALFTLSADDAILGVAAAATSTPGPTPSLSSALSQPTVAALPTLPIVADALAACRRLSLHSWLALCANPSAIAIACLQTAEKAGVAGGDEETTLLTALVTSFLDEQMAVAPPAYVDEVAAVRAELERIAALEVEEGLGVVRSEAAWVNMWESYVVSLLAHCAAPDDG